MTADMAIPKMTPKAIFDSVELLSIDVKIPSNLMRVPPKRTPL